MCVCVCVSQHNQHIQGFPRSAHQHIDLFKLKGVKDSLGALQWWCIFIIVPDPLHSFLDTFKPTTFVVILPDTFWTLQDCQIRLWEIPDLSQSFLDVFRPTKYIFEHL